MNIAIDPVEMLLTSYPTLESIRPVAIGITYDLIALGWPEGVACRAMSNYCSTPAYLKACLVAGSPRYNLNGHQRGIVDQVHASWAAARLGLAP